MKLRRTLSVSAVTAALIPLAVAAAPATQAAPAPKMPTCSDVDTAYGQYHNNFFAGRSFGVPDTVRLGDEWHVFTATLTNVSKKELKSFSLRARVDSNVYNEGEHGLSPYADLQYWDAAKREWKTLRQGDAATGGIPGPSTLKPRESVHVQLRFRVREGLSHDQSYDSYAYLYGTFVDRYRGIDCTTSDVAGSTFNLRWK
ncbi:MULTISPECIES: hypothetical protein [Streptomyces]|uniref:Uncharacterized protein n=2 Tax=Streptomyces rimosus subsp. rimosus TaxID=132474 RepID=L8EF34_STRR1|nr:MULTISPECIES: hypothetical protein [Streptomyces]KOG78206.1 hypothetical protein ADK78_07340 [Kitasatospora aureofaciens]MYT43760.1 hypothetical protein [Streptomyces sp. SID5471]KOT30428.1 hypothetical protein ADK42_29975 [Streptomyces rimosus subsp. rimosus]KOT46073.1 hypothetical protein ADK84_03420 [Streptomyces sp. NRRL WC-3701]KOT52975.1 hypothetical protein ADK44_30100 [Streptomyces rimosus subsp. rimosus]